VKLTEKFPPSIRPIHPGVYLTQRPTSNCAFWRAFDGKDWRYGAAIAREEDSPSYEAARYKPKIPDNLVNFEWHGLADKP
jgi:hypothetical protein